MIILSTRFFCHNPWYICLSHLLGCILFIIGIRVLFILHRIIKRPQPTIIIIDIVICFLNVVCILLTIVHIILVLSYEIWGNISNPRQNKTSCGGYILYIMHYSWCFVNMDSLVCIVNVCSPPSWFTTSHTITAVTLYWCMYIFLGITNSF